MALMIHVSYRGRAGHARQFAREMTESGNVARIRKAPGNLQYAYFYPVEDEETVLLVDCWTDQAALDRHHASPVMKEIALLRDKYDLHMTVERFRSDDTPTDSAHIRL